MDNLSLKTEGLRQEMHLTALEKGISHPDVLKVSQRLDKVMNEFYNAGIVQKMDAKQQLGRGNIKLRQQAILDFIRNYPYQYPPTVREIRVGVGLKSSSTVHHHLTELVNQGLVERKGNCIVLIESSM